MSRQGRLLAAQAVLSALILLVVYVTLLRPEGGGSLSGVETPDGSLPAPGQADQQRGDRAAGDRSRRGAPAVATTPGATPGILGPGVLEGQPLPTGVPVTGIEGPADDQYTDSLGQLRARLAAG
jgi:hypothetical protein